MIAATKKHGTDRKAADLEALRIIEKYSFDDVTESNNEEMSTSMIRERIWSVLADIVEGLSWCRRNQGYFHRSIYRHAQALLWAPLFHNPDGAVGEGSVRCYSFRSQQKAIKFADLTVHLAPKVLK